MQLGDATSRKKLGTCSYDITRYLTDFRYTITWSPCRPVSTVLWYYIFHRILRNFLCRHSGSRKNLSRNLMTRDVYLSTLIRNTSMVGQSTRMKPGIPWSLNKNVRKWEWWYLDNTAARQRNQWDSTIFTVRLEWRATPNRSFPQGSFQRTRRNHDRQRSFTGTFRCYDVGRIHVLRLRPREFHMLYCDALIASIFHDSIRTKLLRVFECGSLSTSSTHCHCSMSMGSRIW